MALYLCIKQFNSRLGDELNLKIGDKIEVLADDNEYNDGWYMGKNLTTGEVGLYPKSFTQELVDETADSPSLLRSRSRRLASLNSQGQSSPVTHLPLLSNTNNSVNKTMNDIDKALEELQIDSKLPMNKPTVFSKISQYEHPNPQPLAKPPKPPTSHEPVAQETVSHHGTPRTGTPRTGTPRTDTPRLATPNEIPPVNSQGPQPSTSASAWTPEQTKQYFLEKGFEPLVCEKFVQHKITGEILFELDLTHLKELDIDSFGTRFAIHKQIEQLKKEGIPPTPIEPDYQSSVPASQHEREPVPFNDAINDDPLPNFKFGAKSTKSVKNPDKEYARPVSSIYDSVHSRNQSKDDYYHRRNSSVLSNNFDYLQGKNKEKEHRRHSSTFSWKDNEAQEKLISPVKIRQSQGEINIDNTTFSPKKEKQISLSRHSSNDYGYNTSKGTENSDSDHSASNITPNAQQPSRFKTLRTASTQNFKSLTTSKKLKTSAFTEGIRTITPDEAIKTASYSGFMSKKSGNHLSWRSRYFTLHGTRLLYFTSLKDKKEKGLIDITAHKVIPIGADGEDKYNALYASSTGAGRYCFKLTPPAPGFKKGLTFTQPKVHYFAVETEEDMRGWIKALMTATIDIDDSVPVVSSYSTPTISLVKAQELLAKAREETKLKDEENQNKEYLLEFNGGEDFGDSQLTSFIGNYTLDPNSSGDTSPLVEQTVEQKITKKLSIDTREPSTPTTSSQTGFASPYLLASGLLSPKDKIDATATMSTNSRTMSTNSRTASLNGPTSATSVGSQLGNGFGSSSNVLTPVDSTREFFPDDPKRKKKRNSEKLMAYSSDGSGNHTFYIKQKR